MKKIIALFVMLVFACCMSAELASAAQPNTISLSTATAKVGGSVTLTMTLDNNQGIANLMTTVGYDADALTLTGVRNGELFDTLTGAEVSTGRNVNLKNSEGKDVTGDGVLAYLDFTIKDGAASKEYSITVTFNQGNNASLQMIECVTNNGKITVTHEHQWKTEVTKVATCKEEGVKELTCTLCGEKKTETIAKNPSNHADYGTEVKGAKAATDTAKGYTGDTVCKGCGTVLEKGKEIPIPDPTTTIHTHTLTKTAAKAATCTEAGNVEYYTCSGCNKTFSDAEGTKEIKNVTVPAKGHTFGTWTVEKEATKTEEGLKSRTCTVCGYNETQKIAKLPEPSTSVILDTSVLKSFVEDKNPKPAEKAKDDGKCPAADKADPETKTVKPAAKNIKTDSGKNTGDNGIFVIMTGLVALAGAAIVVTKKKRS